MQTFCAPPKWFLKKEEVAQWTLQKQKQQKQIQSSKKSNPQIKMSSEATLVKWKTESHTLRQKTRQYTLSTRVTSLTENSLGGKVPSQDKSSLTLIHVSGEASQDATQRCCIKKVHGAEEETAEELVVEHRGSLHSALSTQATAVFEHET